MSKAIVNRQQAEALSELASLHGPVNIEYDYGSRLIVSWDGVPRATIHSTGKVEIDETMASLSRLSQGAGL